MGKINSRRKGAKGELEFAHECEKYGFENVHRTAQLTGKVEGASADCIGLEGIHIEVKRVEALNLDNAMEQAIRDSKVQAKGNIPVVFHRKNRKPWKASMLFEDWVEMYKAWLEKRGE